MTPDEKFEALTMNLELMYKMHESLENRHSEALSEIANAVIKIDRAFLKLSTLIEMHESRINKLEKNK